MIKVSFKDNKYISRVIFYILNKILVFNLLMILDTNGTYPEMAVPHYAGNVTESDAITKMSTECTTTSSNRQYQPQHSKSNFTFELLLIYIIFIF